MTINEEKFSADDLRLLAGEDEIKEPKGFTLLVARALHNPMKTTLVLKDICALCLKEEDQRDMRLSSFEFKWRRRCE